MLNFSESLYETRLKATREKFPEWKIEALLIGSPTNRRWLSGFTGSAAWLLVTEDQALLGTDFRYWDQARRQAPKFELFEFKGSFEKVLPEFIGQADVSRVGIEAQFITLDQYAKMKGLDEIVWVKVGKTLESFREVKHSEEIDTVRLAAEITDKTMALVPTMALLQTTERELAWKLERELRENGATGMAFPPIVASGPNAALAHHEPGERTLKEGDPLIVDMGAELYGYKSDLTRSFFVGSGPDETFDKLYNIVLDAQETALNTMRAGMSGKEVDSLARDVIEAAGFAEAFGHSLGHGVGLDIHEEPRLSQLADDTPLPAGSVVTVEPGIYISEWGGIRIEDLVLLTEKGSEYLSHCPKEPYVR